MRGKNRASGYGSSSDTLLILLLFHSNTGSQEKLPLPQQPRRCQEEPDLLLLLLNMAHANISVPESQFRCPVCLDLLKDPVSTPCGHTYCMSCINNYWDQADSGHFSCPQCRESFSPRPVLRRNTVLAEVVDKLKPSEALEAPELYLGGVGDVPCDFCPVDGKLRAVKSCLVCLASFCGLHVAPHREVGTLRRHKLVEAVESLPERLCAQHRLGLEPQGGGSEAEEWSGDCLLCEADQEEVHGGDAQRTRRQVHTAVPPPTH